MGKKLASTPFSELVLKSLNMNLTVPSNSLLWSGKRIGLEYFDSKNTFSGFFHKNRIRLEKNFEKLFPFHPNSVLLPFPGIENF